MKRFKTHWLRMNADLPVPLWFALLCNVVFMLICLILGYFLAPCIDYIGF